MAEHGPSEKAIGALTQHLQSEWAGPYMARISDFSAEEIAAGKLKAADAEADGEAHEAARAALAAAHDPALGLARSVCLRDVYDVLSNAFHPQNPTDWHPADVIERAFTEQPSSPEGQA